MYIIYSIPVNSDYDHITVADNVQKRFLIDPSQTVEEAGPDKHELLLKS